MTEPNAAEPTPHDNEVPLLESARAILSAHCELRRSRRWGEGPDRLVGGAFRYGTDEDRDLATARAFQQALFDAGLAWLNGPTEFGGRSCSEIDVADFWAVMEQYDVPDLSWFHIGQRILAPAVLEHGTDEQRERWLRPLFRGDMIACQLFSEPDAGSDLASLRTRATPEAGGWRINGAKLWSSGAYHSDLGELLARTEPGASSPSAGLTMFVIEMSSPGVEVRPIRQLNGTAHFCEVTLDDVFVPDSERLGERGRGWRVAQASLASERTGFARRADHLFPDLFDRLIELSNHEVPLPASARGTLAQLYTEHRINQLLAGHLDRSSGAVRSVAPSLLKLAATEHLWRVAQHASRILGPLAIADGGRWGCYSWSHVILGAPARRIAGGTNEIQRNIVAERGLGLPREPRREVTADDDG